MNQLQYHLQIGGVMTRNDYIVKGLNDSIGFLYSYTIDLENKVEELTNELNEMKQLLTNNNLYN